MPSFKRLLSSIFLYFTVPLTTLAQTLVPACGATSLGGYTQEYQYLAATSCNFCWLAQLVQNIVNFLIMVSIPISIALFAWAGILFFTSAANPKGIGRAKKIFMSVLIGFAIALSGWVLVQVLLQTITNSTFYESTATWFKLDCKQYDKARPRNKTLNQVLGTLQAVGAPSDPGGSTTVVGTPAGSGPGATGTPVTVSESCKDPSGCSETDARSAINIFNAQSLSPLESAPGVSYKGVNPELLQSVFNTVSGSSAGTVTITSAERDSATPSNHTSGNAFDVGFNNTQFNNYIQSFQQVSNVQGTGLPAYSVNGYTWVQEVTGTNGRSTGPHWHVSKTGN